MAWPKQLMISGWDWHSLYTPLGVLTGAIMPMDAPLTQTAVSQSTLTQAVSVLRDGGVIAYPTEAVWGLGCDPSNEAAVKRILTLKDRAQSKGVILVAASVDQVSDKLYALTDAQRNDAVRAWTNPEADGCVETLIVPDPEHLVPAWVRGAHSSVAIRVSHHPVVKALCERFGSPIVSTSANVSGQPPAMSAEDVDGYFSTHLNYVVLGELGHRASPSRIRDVVTGSVLR